MYPVTDDVTGEYHLISPETHVHADKNLPEDCLMDEKQIELA